MELNGTLYGGLSKEFLTDTENLIEGEYDSASIRREEIHQRLSHVRVGHYIWLIGGRADALHKT